MMLLATLMWTGLVIASLGIVGLLGWGLHKFCCHLEERGWIYYRKSSQGGGNPAGALMELDKITRPSVEHVIEAQNSTVRVEETGIDGD